MGVRQRGQRVSVTVVDWKWVMGGLRGVQGLGLGWKWCLTCGLQGWQGLEGCFRPARDRVRARVCTPAHTRAPLRRSNQTLQTLQTLQTADGRWFDLAGFDPRSA